MASSRGGSDRGRGVGVVVFSCGLYERDGHRHRSHPGVAGHAASAPQARRERDGGDACDRRPREPGPADGPLLAPRAVHQSAQRRLLRVLRDAGNRWGRGRRRASGDGRGCGRGCGRGRGRGRTRARNRAPAPSRVLLRPGVDLTPLLVSGSRFTFKMPEDVIVPRKGVTTSYGLVILFNFACTGHIELLPY